MATVYGEEKCPLYVCMYCMSVCLYFCLSVCGWLVVDIIFFLSLSSAYVRACVVCGVGRAGAGLGVAVGTARYGVGGGGWDTEARGEICGWRSGMGDGTEVGVGVCSKKAKMLKCDRQQRRDGELGEVVLERREKGRKERGDAGLCGW